MRSHAAPCLMFLTRREAIKDRNAAHKNSTVIVSKSLTPSVGVGGPRESGIETICRHVLKIDHCRNLHCMKVFIVDLI